jgi:hypothetical protein
MTVREFYYKSTGFFDHISDKILDTDIVIILMFIGMLSICVFCFGLTNTNNEEVV